MKYWFGFELLVDAGRRLVHVDELRPHQPLPPPAPKRAMSMSWVARNCSVDGAALAPAAAVGSV